MDDVDQILQIVEIKPKRIFCYINPKWKHVLYEQAARKFKRMAPTIKDIINLAKKEPDLQPYMKMVAKEAQVMVRNPSVFKISILSPIEQKLAIIIYEKYFAMKYENTEISIHFNNETNIYDPNNKRFYARPMKPAIYIE